MKAKFLLFAAFLSVEAWAYLPEEIVTHKCRKVLEKTLKKNASKDNWVRTVDPQKDVQAFRSPTENLGTWVEIQTFENPYLFVFSPDKSHVYKFSGKDCSVLTSTDTKAMNFLNYKGDGFTDLKLKELVKADKPSMIYIWSPDMVYSMSEMSVFKQVAKEQGLQFVPVLDMSQSPEEAKKLSSGHGLNIPMTKLQSVELYMREGNLHFPTTFIVGRNRISDRVFGVLTPQLLTERVLEEVAAINRVEK